MNTEGEMNTTHHMRWMEVLDHVEAGGPSGPHADHLRRCRSCRQMEIDATAILGALPIAGLPSPSDDLIEGTWRRMTAIAMGGASAEQQQGETGGLAALRGRLREIWAVLVSPPLVPSHAVRGTATPRLMMYETDEFVVSISISEGSARMTRELLGKVIPRVATRLPEKGRVILRQSGREETGDLSEFGGFRFVDIPSGEIAISIEVASALIRIPPIS